MKKATVIALVVVLALSATASVGLADDPVEYTYNTPNESHKVRNKLDISGTFTAHPGYNWGGLAEGATWTYRIHIKEAMNGDFSVGSIHFVTDGIDVVGYVRATKSPYPYWSGNDVLAAVGTAEYNDTAYYFMFLIAERAVWFCLSNNSYDSAWNSGTVWQGGRLYQLHSLNPGTTLTLDYKVIHE